MDIPVDSAELEDLVRRGLAEDLGEKDLTTDAMVPEEALIPSGSENVVLVVDRSTDPPVARRRRVTTGARRPGAVEVLGHTDWSDPGRLFTFRLARPDSGRFLTGADLDPE